MGRSLQLCGLGVAVLVVGALVAPAPSWGKGMQEGFAVAVTADGTRLIAGGKNRVLYDLDPATFEVKRRVHLGRQIMKMVFSPDGSVLVVESTKVVQFLKADTLEPFETLKDAEDIWAVPALDAVAIQARGRNSAIRLLGFADAKEKASVPYDGKQSVAAFGVSPDGKKLALLYSRRKDENEEKVAWKDIPAELTKKRDAALREYQQHHDGMAAVFLVFEISSGKTLLERQLWYAAPNLNNMLVWHGDDVFVIGYDNQNARIDKSGEVTYFELGNSFNYAFEPTPDGAAFWTGGLRSGTRTKADGLAATGFEIDQVEGFPEYYKAFSVAKDGTAFAGTTAYRVVRFSPDGKVQKIAPIH
jgi:hypothetical protein